MAGRKWLTVAMVVAGLLLSERGWGGQTAIAIRIPVTPELVTLFQQKGVSNQGQASNLETPTLVVSHQGDSPLVYRFNAQGRKLALVSSVREEGKNGVFTVVSF